MNEVNLAEQSSFVWAIISHHSIVVVSNNGDEIEKKDDGSYLTSIYMI